MPVFAQKSIQTSGKGINWMSRRGPYGLDLCHMNSGGWKKNDQGVFVLLIRNRGNYQRDYSDGIFNEFNFKGIGKRTGA